MIMLAMLYIIFIIILLFGYVEYCLKMSMPNVQVAYYCRIFKLLIIDV